MPSDHAEGEAPAADWRIIVAEHNLALLRREHAELRELMTDRLHTLATRVTVLEVKVGLWSAGGALLGSIAGAVVAGLLLYLLAPAR